MQKFFMQKKRSVSILFIFVVGLFLSWYGGYMIHGDHAAAIPSSSDAVEKFHYGWFSLLPALLTLSLAWISREPLLALITGTVSGALLLGSYSYFDTVLLPSFASKSSASVLLLYLLLLGSLIGIWSKTGATSAFANFATHKFVKGPRSAKFVAWLLGFVFFQGGTISSVLVGTSVKPVADKHRVSHEELSCIVDATSAPVAIVLAFNAWPIYVQSFLSVSGVSFLATEQDRINFFFSAIPINFYAIASLIATLLLAFDKTWFTGKRMRDAISRARSSGMLDAKDAKPLSTSDISDSDSICANDLGAKEKKSSAFDFLFPLFSLIATAFLTFFILGSPNVNAAFSFAILSGIFLALYRGFSLHEVFMGISQGLKSVVFGAVILLLAVAIGKISQDTGAGNFLITLMGDRVHWVLLPYILLLLTMVISFSTGTSWATFAVVFPIAMPIAWEFAMQNQMQNPYFYMLIVFSMALNGSIFGDQCSPISDTSILSSMSTGCDLMDHVKSQMPLAVKSMSIAIIGWGVLLFFI